VSRLPVVVHAGESLCVRELVVSGEQVCGCVSVSVTILRRSRRVDHQDHSWLISRVLRIRDGTYGSAPGQRPATAFQRLQYVCFALKTLKVMMMILLVVVVMMIMMMMMMTMVVVVVVVMMVILPFLMHKCCWTTPLLSA
jgi:ABC-type bacteriocin/lantibiotic exporter with double-glycine peptidase domain